MKSDESQKANFIQYNNREYLSVLSLSILSRRRKILILIALFLIINGCIYYWLGSGNRSRAKHCRLVSATIIAMERATPNYIEQDKILQNEICQIMDCPINKDVLSMAYRLRLYKKLAPHFEAREWEKSFGAFEEELLQALHKGLFFWSRTEYIGELLVRNKENTERKGIVITTGMKTLNMAVHLIKSIRKVFHCDLPIQVLYDGKKDLSTRAIDYLEKIPKTKCVDLNQIFSLKKLELQGWDFKPFAMLASSFTEVLLLDADVVLMQSPNVFFDNPQYERSGALFFKDRRLLLRSIDYPKWFSTIIPSPHSESLKTSEMYQKKTNYQQESGVVLIDKSQCLYGLLSACLLNLPGAKTILHHGTYGEKESFWIGFEIAQDPYEFYGGVNGAIGSEEEKQKLTGKIAHFDYQNRIFWFNDGILENKRNPNSLPGKLSHIVYGGSWYYLTMINSTVHELDQESLHRLDEIKNLWEDNPITAS